MFALVFDSISPADDPRVQLLHGIELQVKVVVQLGSDFNYRFDWEEGFRIKGASVAERLGMT